MRSSLALIATAGLVAVALSGCATAPAPEASPGQSTDAVTVTGDFGEKPRVEFPAPLVPKQTQCSEIIAGEGDRLQDGQFVLLGASLFNGTTGDEIQTIGYGDDDPANLVIGASWPAFDKGLSCAREGSRVVVVAPSEDLDPSTGEGGDSVVAVFDVKQAFPARADGAPRLTRDGFPAVVLAPDGRPGITIPGSDPPVDETSEVEVLKQGSGQTVEDGDTVVVQYTGVLWDDSKTVFASSWADGEPAVFVVGEGDAAQVVPGFSKAVVGQQVVLALGDAVPERLVVAGAIGRLHRLERDPELADVVLVAFELALEVRVLAALVVALGVAAHARQDLGLQQARLGREEREHQAEEPVLDGDPRLTRSPSTSHTSDHTEPRAAAGRPGRLRSHPGCRSRRTGSRSRGPCRCPARRSPRTAAR